jgi:protein ImuB
VLEKPVAVDVLDAAGATVTVTGRGLLTAPPARLTQRGRAEEVTGWAGPWVLDERWWDPETAARQARFQLVTADGIARLLAIRDGRWWIEAVYE